MIPPAISLSQVTWVGRTGRVLDGVDAEVIPGEVVAVVGGAGTGKSTMLRVAAGIARAHAGQARVGSWDAKDARVRKIVGYAPQDPAWLAAFTVRELLEYWGRFHVRGSPVTAVRDALAVSGLELHADDPISAADVSVRRRLALAQAVLGGRRVLVLDELLTGLDPAVRQELAWRLESRAAAGVAILLSAGSLEAVERVATRVLVLRHGRVARVAAPTALLAERVLDVILDRPALAAPSGFRLTPFGLQVDLSRVTPEAALATCRAYRLSVRASHVRAKSLEELAVS
ncbi:MAG TPA: ABC transporter ATP-binding protein [Gemmatimonadales bacterium]|nr:ABC transporter ATP-binding protein [Gemmatimonadales bacterium]